MGSARFRRPDGRDGTYSQWLAEVSAKWNALSAAEQAASRDAASARLMSQIRAQSAGEPTLMHIYDEIGWFGVWPADVVEALSNIKGDVEVHLHSPGGNVFDGLAIYETLKQHPGDVSMVVDGLAASAASFIAMAASPGKLQMTPNSTMMVHDAWGMCVGNASKMAEMAGLLEETSDNIASIYAERGGRTAAEYRSLMQAETWAVGQRAVDLRLADSVRKAAETAPAGPPALVPAASGALWQVTILAADGGPAEHGHEGQPCWDPDGDGDCDLTPEGDTDHDFWAPDGTQKKPVPGKPMSDHHGHQIHAAAVDESAWDGPAAMSAASKADNPAAALSAICAGKRAGDPATQAAHALPHHKHPGDAPNRHGVTAALGRIAGTDGLTNKDAAQAHLDAHKAAMGAASDADDHTELPVWLRNA